MEGRVVNVYFKQGGDFSRRPYRRRRNRNEFGRSRGRFPFQRPKSFPNQVEHDNVLPSHYMAGGDVEENTGRRIPWRISEETESNGDKPANHSLGTLPNQSERPVVQYDDLYTKWEFAVLSNKFLTGFRTWFLSTGVWLSCWFNDLRLLVLWFPGHVFYNFSSMWINVQSVFARFKVLTPLARFRNSAKNSLLITQPLVIYEAPPKQVPYYRFSFIYWLFSLVICWQKFTDWLF